MALTLGPERFLREIKITARFDHPRILALCDSCDADGFPYYVMPFVDGESLRDPMTCEGQLPLGDALRLVAQVADALTYAAEKRPRPTRRNVSVCPVAHKWGGSRRSGRRAARGSP